MSLLRKAILVNSSQFVCYTIGILQTAILSRTLGPTGIGQCTTILTSLMLTPQLISLGLPLSILYYSHQSPAERRVYLMNAIWVMLLLGTAGGVILSFLVHALSGYFGEISWITLGAIVIYVPLVLQRAISRNYQLIDIEAKKISIIELSAVFGSFTFLLALTLLGILNVDLAVICFILAAVIRATIGWVWMNKGVDFSIRPDWQTIKKLGLMGLRLSWVDLMVTLNAQVTITIIRCTIGNFESVGYYSRGLNVAMLAITAGHAIMPLLFSRWASFPKEKLNVHVEKVMRFASTISVFMIVVLQAAAKWIVLILYGRDFLPAVKPMRILVPGTVLYLMSYILIQLLSSRGKPELAGANLLIGAVVNGILTWFLIQVMDIHGAALATTVANVVLLTSLVLTVKKKHGINFSRCIFVNKEDIRSIFKALSWEKTQNV